MMTLEGKARVIAWHKSKHGAVTYMIYLPSLVSSDSQFPFHADEQIRIIINGRKVTLEKIE